MIDIDQPLTPAATQPPPTALLRTAPVLIVDDTPSKRLAMKAALAPLGHRIVETNSGAAALRCVMEEDFAVILLDVTMPDMVGFETATLIRQRWQSAMTPIIFVTAFSSDEVDPTDRFVGGAVDFLIAPVPPAELRSKVSHLAHVFLNAEHLAARSREVQETADQLRSLTDAAPIGVFRTDSDNRYVYTNAHWTEITGITAHEAIGHAWHSIVDGTWRTGYASPDHVRRDGPRPAGDGSQPWAVKLGHAGFLAVDTHTVQRLAAQLAREVGCRWSTAAAAAGQLLTLMVLVCESDGSIQDAKRLGARDHGVGYRHELPGWPGDAWRASRTLLVDAGALLTDERGYLTGAAPAVWRALVVTQDDADPTRRHWAPVQRHALRAVRDHLTHPRGDVWARRLYLALILGTARGHEAGLVDNDGYLMASGPELAQELGAPRTALTCRLGDLLDLEVIGRPPRPRRNSHTVPRAARPTQLPDVSLLRSTLTGRNLGETADLEHTCPTPEAAAVQFPVPRHASPPPPLNVVGRTSSRP